MHQLWCTSRLTLHCFEQTAPMRIFQDECTLATASRDLVRGGVLKVLDHMLEHGDIDEVHRTIQRQGRQINRIQGLRPRARRH